MDQVTYGTYVPGAISTLATYNAEILVVDYEATVLEGTGTMSNVILKFASEEDANHCYNDPEYAPFKKMGLDATANGRTVLTKQFVMPSE